MSSLTLTHTISAPVERVWDTLKNFGDVYKFHPRVKRSPLLGVRRGGIGAQRRCEFHDGNHIVEQVVGWDDGRSLTIEIVEGSMPLRRAGGRISLQPHGAETIVVFSFEYEPKFGLLGKVMDVMMMRGQFRKMLGEVLDGLETHLRTGAVVGPDGPTGLAAVA